MTLVSCPPPSKNYTAPTIWNFLSLSAARTSLPPPQGPPPITCVCSPTSYLENNRLDSASMGPDLKLEILEV